MEMVMIIVVDGLEWLSWNGYRDFKTYSYYRFANLDKVEMRDYAKKIRRIIKEYGIKVTVRYSFLIDTRSYTIDIKPLSEDDHNMLLLQFGV